MYGGGGGGGGGVKGSINTKSLAVGFRALKSQKQHYTSSLDFSNRNSQLSSSSSSSFGLRLNSLSSSSMATELTRSSLFHSRPVLKALASGPSVLIYFILFYLWSYVFDLDLNFFFRWRRCGRSQAIKIWGWCYLRCACAAAAARESFGFAVCWSCLFRSYFVWLSFRVIN